jgi:hypothetical protein
MSHPPSAPAPPPDFRAALLSFLVPGLGQIVQGRVGKGLLFLLGLYALFFYGMGMGDWKNVFLPDTTGLPPVVLINKGGAVGGGVALPGGVPTALGYRPHYLCQFWVGVAAWPALLQYHNYDRTRDAGPIFGKFERPVEEEELNRLQRDGDKRWDLGWVYTVIAGVLNVLVIYDALAGPAFRPAAEESAARKDPVPA